MSGRFIDEGRFFLSLGGEAQHPLLLAFGNVEIALGPDGDAGGSVESSVDYHARLELAARRGCQIQSKDAAGA